MNEASEGVTTLLRETRVVRQALHELVVRLQHDRREQQRELEAILRSSRLTAPQRQRFSSYLRRMSGR